MGGPKKQDLLIFVNRFFFEKIPSIFDIEIDFESTILALFDELVLPVFSKYNGFLLACRSLAKKLTF